jgi:hypothetical protein
LIPDWIRERERVAPCLDLFEDFCTVTESIRRGVEVRVAVKALSGSEEAGAGGRGAFAIIEVVSEFLQENHGL